MSTKPIAEQFEDDLESCIEKYTGLEGLDYGQIVGTLEIVKLRFVKLQDDEEDYEPL